MIRNATSGWLEGRADTAVLSTLSGGARRLARLPARQTIVNNTRRDPSKPRWARTSGAEACPFCLMLVSRGAVYSKNTAHFEAHDHCRCDAIPVFNDSQIPEESQRLADEWAKVTQGAGNNAEAQKLWADHIKTKTAGAGGGGGRPRKRRSGTDGEGWSRDERKLVDYLRSLGHEVVRVPESDGHGVKTADALVDGVITEFKTLQSNEVRAAMGQPAASVGSLMNAANRSDKQANASIIDARNVPLTITDAEEALRRLKGSPQIKSSQIRFVGRDFDIAGDVR